ncbi:hypothetical protein A2767_02405 [Candidatus Roizmanbacteria bacterium RIFCSPHIGHO2_01_FULL_35_10]|uniref:Pacifastin domain-containing protein n=1 Tax=Candidatus Roizmanbacteria bacterium RIFCSPLOWO2_01_FULL_35_13 TaxID=1802055 RepID=A0A1F7I6Z9_9BACT|nr:MAG: hypothetical protein A2767_02405 [Candidatus Roizmanbacteria bacterium RIFCSPHIGHO2_01_FULL_35_10]OGK39131.1 MAG: hypothetical protein A3A74_08350 [Candidatus Roizmanbacteria bacterium RIFCSPLOWO2_01_FULL_35_13]
MNNKINISALLVMIFILGLMLGYFLGKEQSLKKLNEINPLKKACVYNGKTYQHGQGFQAEDGCNSCGCDNGQITCTTIAC